MVQKIVANREALVALKDVADVFRRKIGRRPCYETVRQWSSKGLRGVVLETVFVGGGKFSSEPAVDRFVEEYTDKRSPTPLPGSIDLRASEAAASAVMDMLDRR